MHSWYLQVSWCARTTNCLRAIYLAACVDFTSTISVPLPSAATPELVLVVSSDRGLCGGINTTLSRTTRKILRGDYVFPAAKKDAASSGAPVTATIDDNIAASADGPRQTRLVIIGDKARTQLSRDAKKSIALSFSQCAKSGPSFEEAMVIADKILADERTAGFRTGAVVYNRFKSAIAYETDVEQLVPAPAFTTLGTPSLQILGPDDEVLRHYYEFQFASTIFCAVAEGYASEITARRAAMDNATKNAGDIILKLTMSYNRQRQAAITNDLVDIITGASAV